MKKGKSLLLIWMIFQILIESLPISSSGHVALVERIVTLPGFTWNDAHHQLIDFLLHGPALCIMMYYFFTTWWQMIMKHSFSMRSFFELQTYQNLVKPILFVLVVDIVTFAWWLQNPGSIIVLYPWSLTFGFVVTALMLYVTWLQKNTKKIEWCLRDAVVLGMAQGFALLPGISRFATTLFAGNRLGYDLSDAFAISFMIQMPLVLAAFIKGLFDLRYNVDFMGQIFDFWMLFGIVGISFISYQLLCLVGRIIQQNRVYVFAYYMILPIIISILV